MKVSTHVFDDQTNLKLLCQSITVTLYNNYTVQYSRLLQCYDLPKKKIDQRKYPLLRKPIMLPKNVFKTSPAQKFNDLRPKLMFSNLSCSENPRLPAAEGRGGSQGKSIHLFYYLLILLLYWFVCLFVCLFV